jgi:hypothetical protein
MVASSDLVRASSKTDAQEMLIKHSEFNIIPLPATGPIIQYMRRDEQEIKKISSLDLISDGTSLLELSRLMSKRDFFFVLSSNTIAGFVHFSDLNKSLMKIPFFILFEAVERHIWPLVSSKLDESDLSKVMDEQRAETLKKRKMKAQKEDVDVGWSGLLYFNEILALAIHYGIIQISTSDREVLANMRNRVVHTDKLLVEVHGDITRLVKTHELCQKILNGG